MVDERAAAPRRVASGEVASGEGAADEVRAAVALLAESVGQVHARARNAVNEKRKHNPEGAVQRWWAEKFADSHATWARTRLLPALRAAGVMVGNPYELAERKAESVIGSWIGARDRHDLAAAEQDDQHEAREMLGGLMRLCALGGQ